MPFLCEGGKHQEYRFVRIMNITRHPLSRNPVRAEHAFLPTRAVYTRQLNRFSLSQSHFGPAVMRSRLTPVDPNTYPMCSNVHSSDACQSKCKSSSMNRRDNAKVFVLLCESNSESFSGGYFGTQGHAGSTCSVEQKNGTHWGASPPHPHPTSPPLRVR